jgi:hypothetical protein
MTRAMHEVVDQIIDGFDRLPPESAHLSEGSARVELALAPDHAAKPRHLFMQPLILLDDVVKNFRHFARKPNPFRRKTYRRIAPFERVERAQDRGHLVGRRGWLQALVLHYSSHRYSPSG